MSFLIKFKMSTDALTLACHLLAAATYVHLPITLHSTGPYHTYTQPTTCMVHTRCCSTCALSSMGTGADESLFGFSERDLNIHVCEPCMQLQPRSDQKCGYTGKIALYVNGTFSTRIICTFKHVFT